MEKSRMNSMLSNSNLIIILLCAGAILLLNSCGSMEKVVSQQKKSEIKIDGNDEEWQNSMAYFEDSKVLVGFKNDKDFLYVCLKTSDSRAIRKIMGLGMTIWLNSEGNKDKTFGIHYPIGNMGKGGFQRDNPRNIGDNKEQSPDDFQNQMKEKTDIMLKDIEFLYDNGEDIKFSSVAESAKKYNITAAINNDKEILTYELAIPINSEYTPLKIKDIKNTSMGLGFETGEFKRPEGDRGSQRSGGVSPGGGMTPGGGGAYPGGGMGGGMGGRGGGGRSRGGGGRRNMQGDGSSSNSNEPMKLWIELKLANQ